METSASTDNSIKSHVHLQQVKSRITRRLSTKMSSTRVATGWEMFRAQNILQGQGKPGNFSKVRDNSQPNAD